MTASNKVKRSHCNIPVTENQMRAINRVKLTFGTDEWFTVDDVAKMEGVRQPAYVCREMVSKGIFEKKKELEHSRLARMGLSRNPMAKTWKIKYRLVANPPLKKKKMKTKTQQYDSDMIAMFFGANHFKSVGKQIWEKDNYRVKVIAGHKFLITNTDKSLKHKHIATVIIPKTDQMMYTLFVDLIGMKLTA